MLFWMIAAFVFFLGPLLFIHEFGHFWAAKRNGVPVEEFGFGLGPKLVTLFVRDGTAYTIRAIPFAAFVRVQGEEDARLERGILYASRRVKLLFFAAGSASNIAVTVLLFWVAYLFGPPAFVRVGLSGVNEGSPAHLAGLKPGDVILRAGEVEILETGDLGEFTASHLGQEVTLLVERDGQKVEIRLTPRSEGEYDPETEGPMGVTMMLVDGPPDPQNVLLAGQSAGADFVEVLVETARWPGRIIQALASRAGQAGSGPGETQTDDDLRYLRPVGIYGILQLVAVTLQAGILQGYWYYVFRTAGLISMALGMTNLLPIPALDGGRIAFVLLDWLYEKLTHRRINPEREMVVHAVGLMMLLVVMVLITWQDIANPLIEFATPTPRP